MKQGVFTTVYFFAIIIMAIIAGITNSLSPDTNWGALAGGLGGILVLSFVDYRIYKAVDWTDKYNHIFATMANLWMGLILIFLVACISDYPTFMRWDHLSKVVIFCWLITSEAFIVLTTALNWDKLEHWKVPFCSVIILLAIPIFSIISIWTEWSVEGLVASIAAIVLCLSIVVALAKTWAD